MGGSEVNVLKPVWGNQEQQHTGLTTMCILWLCRGMDLIPSDVFWGARPTLDVDTLQPSRGSSADLQWMTDFCAQVSD